MKNETVGVSPKVVAAFLTALVTFALTKLAIPWNPIVEQAINIVAPLIAAILAGPGKVQTSRGFGPGHRTR
jgi:uncharacterized membrane protein YphA (DoxX/SURF4 family)